MTERQTISFLTRRFREVGIQPNTRHGQNFLIDLNLVRLLAESAELTRHDVVLEVGTGTGSLTSLLASRAGHVVTVEIDAQLHQLAREELASANNVTMLQQDALKNKNRIDPVVLDAVAEQLDALKQSLGGPGIPTEGPTSSDSSAQESSGESAAGSTIEAEAPRGVQLKLVANLPYNIATPLISNLLRVDRVPDMMVVTIQKELADRLTAAPGKKDYGALSIWVQSLANVEIVRELPPTVFWPRPKVQSAIIRILPCPDKRAGIRDLEFFRNFVRAMFFHRRKFLRSELISAHKHQLTKADVDAIMQQQGLLGNARAEELTIPRMQALADSVQDRLAEVTDSN